jgi:hypothetical protein
MMAKVRRRLISVSNDIVNSLALGYF